MLRPHRTRPRDPGTACTAGDFVETAQRMGFTLDDGQLNAAKELAAGERSLYLVGPAGRGKTWLLDTFCALTRQVLRLHWHEFVRDLHQRIDLHGRLDYALDDLLGTIRNLCFDELHVDDPADGIFLDSLIRSAIRRDIRLIFTSNQRPDELMPNPLFHGTFEPTIALIEDHCLVLALDSGVDYRSGQLTHEAGFASGRWLTESNGSGPRHTVEVMVCGRRITAWDADDKMLNVSFNQICGTPVSATDYLELAGRFTRWVVTDVPDLSSMTPDAALRLVHLVDVLYERDRPLTIESAVPRSVFGATGRQPPGTARLLSRLSTLGSS